MNKKLKKIKDLNLSCQEKEEGRSNKDVKFLKIKDVFAKKDLSSDFLKQIENTDEKFTSTFQIEGEYNIIFL